MLSEKDLIYFGSILLQKPAQKDITSLVLYMNELFLI